MYVLQENFGMDQDVLFQAVLGHKSGMEKNVSVQLVENSMDQFVYNVLMVNNGTIKIKFVNVHQVIYGME